MNNKTLKVSNSLLGSIYVITSAILFGAMPLMTKTIFQHGGNAYTAAFLRFLIGAFVLYIIITFIAKQTVKISRKQLFAMSGFSVFYALMLMLLYSSYSYINSGLATTLHFTYPATVIFLNLIIYKIFPNKKELISLILAITGIFLTSAYEKGYNLLRMTLAIFSGVSYSFYIVLYKNSIIKTIDAIVIAFWISVFAGLELAIYITLSGSWQLPSDTTGWIATTLLAFLTDVLALVLFQKGLKICGGVTSSLLSTFEPITGLLIGYFFYKEKSNIPSIIGIVCILVSVLVLLTKNKKPSTLSTG